MSKYCSCVIYVENRKSYTYSAHRNSATFLFISYLASNKGTLWLLMPYEYGNIFHQLTNEFLETIDENFDICCRSCNGIFMTYKNIVAINLIFNYSLKIREDLSKYLLYEIRKNAKK